MVRRPRGKTEINQTHHHVGAIICTYFVPYATRLIVEALRPLRTAAMPNHWQWRGAQYVVASRMWGTPEFVYFRREHQPCSESFLYGEHITWYIYIILYIVLFLWNEYIHIYIYIIIYIWVCTICNLTLTTSKFWQWCAPSCKTHAIHVHILPICLDSGNASFAGHSTLYDVVWFTSQLGVCLTLGSNEAMCW